MKIALFFANVGRGGGGPEVYEINMIRALAAMDTVNEYHVFCLDQRGPERCNVHRDNVCFHVLQPQARPISMVTSLPMALKRYRPEVVHATFVPPPLPTRNLLFTLPCTAPFAKPEFYPLAIRLRLRLLCEIGVRQARAVLCYSKHVQDYVKNRFDRCEEDLPIVPLAANRAFKPMPHDECSRRLREEFDIDFPYFLFSGRWEARKNILRIIEAFAHFKKNRRSDFKLVFTGRRTWAVRESDRLIRRLGIGNDVVDLGKSPQSDLPVLYAGASAVVYPSLWESFGLVLLEAMNCGTPVITSNIASMPEIAGDAALLVDPYSAGEIASAMDQISSDPELRERLGQAGLRRSKEFSWEMTAAKSLAVYQAMAATN